MMIKEFEKKATYGQFLKNLVPSIITMIFLSFYTTIDGFFVSKYAGSDALAGINIAIPVTCVIFGAAVMLATGSGAMIGERMGQGKWEKVRSLFSFICVVLLIFSIVFTAAGLIFLRPAAAMLGASKRLMPHVLPYMGVIFASTLPMSFKLFFEYLVRTDGSPKVALAMSSTGLILNVILDYIFVGVMNLGTFGAALGTAVSITISALIGLVYFLKFSTIRFARPKADYRALLHAYTNGSSEMFTELSTGITTFLFNTIIFKYYGEDGIAAITIIMYIYYFFIALYMGISVATAPIISYNVGSGNMNKIKETLRYSFITIAVSSVLVFAASNFLGPSIIGLFTEPGHVFDLTWEGLRIFGILFLFIGVNVFMSGYFTALGSGLISAVISLLRSLVLVVAFIFILPLFMGVYGVWAAMPAAELVTLAVSLGMFAVFGKIWIVKTAV